ncbi:MAG: polysaccharide biosynthesis C-terminal domain-containing protein [Gemmataceae bacterium]
MSTCTELPPKEAEPMPAKRRGSWSVVARGGTLAILDQALVSGTSFLSVVLVGRACGEVELGYYSLGVTVLVLLTILQESLITAPYTVFRERLRGRRIREYTGRMLFQQVAMACVSAVAIASTASLLLETRTETALAAAAIAPFMLLRDFCRRLCIIHARVGGALALDLFVGVLQLASLAWLSSTGRLTASLAFGAIGVASGISTAVVLFAIREDFILRGRRPAREFGRHWTFGRWIAAGQAVGVVHGYAVHWLLMVLIGPSATGAFAACLAVALLANPLYLGMSNLLGPWAARARATGGLPALRRLVLRAAGFLVAGMSVFCIGVSLFGERLMNLFYGEAFSGHGFTLTALAASLAVTSAGMSADHGLRTLGRPRIAFVGSAIGLAVTLSCSLLLTPAWSIAGAAFGYLMGTTASSVVRMTAFLKLSSAAEGGE